MSLLIYPPPEIVAWVRRQLPAWRAIGRGEPVKYRQHKDLSWQPYRFDMGPDRAEEISKCFEPYTQAELAADKKPKRPARKKPGTSPDLRTSGRKE